MRSSSYRVLGRSRRGDVVCVVVSYSWCGRLLGGRGAGREHDLAYPGIERHKVGPLSRGLFS